MVYLSIQLLSSYLFHWIWSFISIVHICHFFIQHDNVSTDRFRPLMVIIDIVALSLSFYYLFYIHFFLVLIPISLSLIFCALCEHVLGFHLDSFIAFWSISFGIIFLVVPLGITIHILDLLHLSSIIILSLCTVWNFTSI